MLRSLHPIVVSSVLAFLAFGATSAEENGGGGDPHGNIPEKTIPPVLMYHEIRNLALERSRGEPARPLETSDVTIEAFKQQMEYLSKSHTTISAHQLYDYLANNKPLPPRAVLVTLDDGYLGNFDNGVPVLDSFQHKATFFVHTSYVGVMRGDPQRPTDFNHMSWEQLRSIAGTNRYEVFSHTMTHPRLTSLDAQKIEQELGVSQQDVEKNMGIAAPFLAYPYGAHDRAVVDVAKKYYAMAFIVSRAVQNIDGLFQVPRLIVGKESLNINIFKCRLTKWEQNQEPNACNALTDEEQSSIPTE